MARLMKRGFACALLALLLAGQGCYGDKDFPADPTCSIAYPQCPEGRTCKLGKCVASNTDGGGGTATVSTHAGSTLGFVNGDSAEAKFNRPTGVAQSPGGGVYVTDSDNHAIRLIRAGKVTTVAGTGKQGSDDGKVDAATFHTPYDLAVASNGDIHVADRLNNLIRPIQGTQVSTFAGSGKRDSQNGTKFAASFNEPVGIALDGANVYVSDKGGNQIRKIVSGATVETLAGTNAAGSRNGLASQATFSSPYHLRFANKDLYIADKGNACLRKIELTSKVVTTFAGDCNNPGYQDGKANDARFKGPYGIAMRLGTLYVSDTMNHCIRVVSAGQVSTLAGMCGSQGEGMVNGPAKDARFKAPRGLTVDSTGRVYVADTENHLIRVISP